MRFCRFYQCTHCQLPKVLVFDQKLTGQDHRAELGEIGVASSPCASGPRS